jgi:MFS superfamily sulfate permease-like transporter
MVVKGGNINMYRLLGQLFGQFIEAGFISQIIYFSLREKSGYKKAAMLSAAAALLSIIVFGIVFADFLLSLAIGVPVVIIWLVLDLTLLKQANKKVIEMDDEMNNGKINEEALKRYLQNKPDIRK